MYGKTINEDTDKKLMITTSTSDPVFIDDAVDFSVLSSLEEIHVEGEPDLVVELIDLYLDYAPKKLTAMRDALSSRDSDSLRGAAHSLKGSSSSLGACQIAALCDELEASANDMSSPGVIKSLIKVEHEFQRVRLIFVAERRKRMS